MKKTDKRIFPEVNNNRGTPLINKDVLQKNLDNELMGLTNSPKEDKYFTTTLKKSLFIDELIKCNGNITATLQSLRKRDISISEATIRYWKEKDSRFVEKVNNALYDSKQKIIDMSENVIVKQLNKDNLTAAMFVLETIGKERGWNRNPIASEVKVVINQLTTTNNVLEEILKMCLERLSEEDRELILSVMQKKVEEHNLQEPIKQIQLKGKI